MMRRIKDQWQDLIGEHESSGMWVSEWCEAQGIPQSTFTKHYSVVAESQESRDTQWVAVTQATAENYNVPFVKTRKTKIS